MCRFGLGLEYRKRTEKWVVSGRYGRVGLGWASAEPILVWAPITLSWALTWVLVGKSLDSLFSVALVSFNFQPIRGSQQRLLAHSQTILLSRPISFGIDLKWVIH